jgi:hypothetical protein
MILKVHIMEEVQLAVVCLPRIIIKAMVQIRLTCLRIKEGRKTNKVP